ncbi:hypothetical protein D3C75_1223390 [compost metagenome]
MYQLVIPNTLAAGQYHLDVGLLDNNGLPRIQLANEGKQADGWYRLSSVMIH